MKPVLAVCTLMITLTAAAADDPAPRPSESTDAVSRELIRRPRTAARRLPAAALQSRESAAESQTTAEPTEAVDLSGKWLLTLPAGFQYRVTIDALGKGWYRLRDAVCFSGVYKLNGEVLQIEEPSDENLDVFDWQLHNVNSMTLVNETGASGAEYVGATLGRQVDWEAVELPRKITAIGRRAVPGPHTTRAATGVARMTTVTGTAFNDETHGPYLETDDTIVFVAGIEQWPPGAVSNTVEARGTISRFVIQDQGESLTAQRMALESWSTSVPLEERINSPRVSPRQTLTGLALHDASHGPYLETDEKVYFVAGIDEWPRGALGRTVEARGTIARLYIQDDGESEPAQRLTLESWSTLFPVEQTIASPRVSPRRRLTGRALHDNVHGPYLETDEEIVYITISRREWPDEVLGKTVVVTGTLSRFYVLDEGESVPAQRLELEAWSRVEGVEQ